MTVAEVQLIAKQTMSFIREQIKVGLKLPELRQIAESKMLSLGATSFWYWDVGAFIFSGKDTTRSISGKRYKTSKKLIGYNDIITIDLSPQVGNVWGDFARTIVIEDGVVIDDIRKIKNTDWREGLLMEEKLHELLLDFAKPKTTFEQLYYFINDYIHNSGYINVSYKHLTMPTI